MFGVFSFDLLMFVLNVLSRVRLVDRPDRARRKVIFTCESPRLFLGWGVKRRQELPESRTKLLPRRRENEIDDRIGGRESFQDREARTIRKERARERERMRRNGREGMLGSVEPTQRYSGVSPTAWLNHTSTVSYLVSLPVGIQRRNRSPRRPCWIVLPLAL